MATTKEELWKIEAESKAIFIKTRVSDIDAILKYAAKYQKRIIEVPYHPLLDSFFNELIKGGLKIESRTLDKITLSWLT
jgi:hypothetical protein